MIKAQSVMRRGSWNRMGDCYFIHAFRNWRYSNNLRKPEIIKIRSEDCEEFLYREGNRVLNTTFGIWFYEGNLVHGKAKLKKDLQDLIKMIDGIKE